MCLAYPSRVVAVAESPANTIIIEQFGKEYAVRADLLLVSGQALAELVGQWVIAYQGFAMSIVPAEEAEQINKAAAFYRGEADDLDVSEVLQRQLNRSGGMASK